MKITVTNSNQTLLDALSTAQETAVRNAVWEFRYKVTIENLDSDTIYLALGQASTTADWFQLTTGKSYTFTIHDLGQVNLIAWVASVTDVFVIISPV